MSLATFMSTLDITVSEGRVRVAERRRLRVVRVLGESVFAAGALAIFVRLLIWAVTLAPLWALPAALLLIVVVLCFGRIATAALERDVADVVGDTLFASDTRLTAAQILSIESESNDDVPMAAAGVRITCIGGARSFVLFKGYRRREREAGAQALRLALGVPPVELDSAFDAHCGGFNQHSS